MSQAFSTYQPLVSIIVITYNSGKFVLETLDSISAQSYHNIELIISDDASSDNTLQLCEAWLRDNSSRFSATKLIKTDKNSGISANCNRGVEKAGGEWIKIIAGDDCLEEGIIQNYVQFISENRDATCLYSNVCEYDDVFDAIRKRPLKNMRNFKINDPHVTAEEQFEFLLRKNPVWASTIIIRKDILEKIGRFNEKYAFFEDRPMLLSLTKAGHKIHYLDIVGAKYRRHSESVQKVKNNVFMSRLKQDQQDFFINECLSFYDKREQVVILYKTHVNRFLKKAFNNRKNFLVKSLSGVLNLFPEFYLAINRKKSK